MDLQTRKLEFIKQLLQIQSEELLSRLERVLKKEIVPDSDEDFKPISEEELNTRIDASLQDSESGKLKDETEAKAEIDKWR